MKKQLATWQLIKDSIEKNIAVMLLYVLESAGSSPGRQGFFMAVDAEGRMEGSIGGGIMEHKLVELAKQLLSDLNPALQVKKQVHDKAAAKNQSGMICSGEQTVLIYPLQLNDVAAVEAIIKCLLENRSGTFGLSPTGISFSVKSEPANTTFTLQSEKDWQYSTTMGYKNHLYIIGGGHCALAFSRLMSGMDFYIHLFEEREGLNTLEQNNFVHEKQIVASYTELTSLIPSGPDQYVVIMTFGYRTDDIALRALMHKKFKYLGVLGSRKKIEKMWVSYKAEGISESLLERIHAPVGINIKSETPEEIAISIAAEIIKVKNS